MTMLRAHDGKPQVIIAGGCNDSICASTDGGLTWTVTGPGLPFAPYIMAAANPDGSRFFIGTQYKAFPISIAASRDDGMTLKKIRAWIAEEFRRALGDAP